MLRTRVIPCLTLIDNSLVKTINFRKLTYIGDPINSVRIFNELEVDELIFLDIRASVNKKPPPFKLISEIATECFMPFSYGGGITTLDDAKKIFDSGVEKISLNAITYQDSNLIEKVSNIYGEQSIIAALDIKKPLLHKKYTLYSHSGKKKHKIDLVERLKILNNVGVGEILLNSIDRDGTMMGFDLDIIKEAASVTNTPLIALGGAGKVEDIVAAKQAGASAVALGSMCVYQNSNRGILINYPTPNWGSCN